MLVNCDISDDKCVGNPCGLGGSCSTVPNGERLCECMYGFMLDPVNNTCTGRFSEHLYIKYPHLFHCQKIAHDWLHKDILFAVTESRKSKVSMTNKKTCSHRYLYDDQHMIILSSFLMCCRIRFHPYK